MIIMLMGDENRVDAVRIFTDGFEAFSKLSAAKAGVDDQSNGICFNKRRIAAAPTSQHRYCYSHGLGLWAGLRTNKGLGPPFSPGSLQCGTRFRGMRGAIQPGRASGFHAACTDR